MLFTFNLTENLLVSYAMYSLAVEKFSYHLLIYAISVVALLS